MLHTFLLSLAVITLMWGCGKDPIAAETELQGGEENLVALIENHLKSAPSSGKALGSPTNTSHSEELYGIALFGSGLYGKKGKYTNWNFLMNGALHLRSIGPQFVSPFGPGIFSVNTTTDGFDKGFIFKIPVADGVAPQVNLSTQANLCGTTSPGPISIRMDLSDVRSTGNHFKTRFRQTLPGNSVAVRGLILGSGWLKARSARESCVATGEVKEISLGKEAAFFIRFGNDSAFPLKRVTGYPIHLFDESGRVKFARDTVPVFGTELNPGGTTSGAGLLSRWKFEKGTLLAEMESRYLDQHPGGVLMHFNVEDSNGHSASCSTKIIFKIN